MSDSIPDDLTTLGAAEAARLIASKAITSSALVEACLARIDEREPQVCAWTCVNKEAVLDAASQADAVLARGYGVGPLHGVPVGVKDIIDTNDMPTENGYRGHAGRRPTENATVVDALRDAGALIMGKTVTTELAVREPGPTRNPVNLKHTPGGSSSGSTAAVRDGMVPAALGTQTGGSVIRPASYCGVFGYKPTFGLISRHGVCMQAQGLDTVGCFGRTVEDLAVVADCLTAQDPRDPDCVPRSRPPLHRFALSTAQQAPKFAFVRTPVWDQASEAARDAIVSFAYSLDATCETVALPNEMHAAWVWHKTLQHHGIARNYGPLFDEGGDLMSESLQEQVALGRQISAAGYKAALEKRDVAHQAVSDILDKYDAILTLSSPGPAPRGLGSTGDPVFNSFWTYAGTPCVNLPFLTVDGLPMGVQMVGKRHADGPLLRTARWLENKLTQKPG